jgi:hypothetical protein
MRSPRLLAAFIALLPVVLAQAADLGWPDITRENKPWTRWWWPGSAVDKASLTRQLEQLAAAGIGGVEITPIYGAKGYEERYIEFLSPKWMEMLEHTGREAKRLGLGVDMATGTGWPFGGPWVTEADALQRAGLSDGKLTGVATKMAVKRAAPGGEGLVLDPYSADALRRYLTPFDKAFASFPRGLVRGQFHDSFEYYQSSWTAKFADTFREMHGYDVQQFAAVLMTAKAADVTTIDRETLARVKADFRDTLGKLHLDYLRTWVEWSHRHGFIVRNQSHGAPANLFDLYANADIAETETFGSTPFPIPGLRRNPDEIRTGNVQDLPEPLVMRMASSAGHVVGHNLSSSESATWLRDHWKVSLAYVKPELDRILADGINHIFYHGTVFSPQDAPWPGWLFYASTQFQPNNTWWDDFSALNRYIGRVQSILQGGKPDNDILLYWPLADVWDNPDGLMKMLGVHDVKWLTEQPVGTLARALMNRGYSFDYISDAQLQQTAVRDAALQTPGGRYKVIIVPATRRMPVATMRQLVELARAGAIVHFLELPADVPGYGRLEQRRAELAQLKADAKALSVNKRYGLGIGQGLSPDQSGLNDVILDLNAPREPIADTGISFIRRKSAEGHDYFFTNLTAKGHEGWIQLATPARTAALLDPLTGRHGAAGLRRTGKGKAEIFVQLAPGESLVLRTLATRTLRKTAPWPYREPAGDARPLSGNWSISFTKGGPELPPALETAALKSWTEIGGDEAKRFGGTARYRLEFDAPSGKADDWLLDLGDVRESARVRVNGKDVTTLWSLPFRTRVGEYLKSGRNVLELDVTNLAANRIRDMDQRKVPWKIMREINFVNINYSPFDASGWALTPSGLLGPVTLTPLRAKKL